MIKQWLRLALHRCIVLLLRLRSSPYAVPDQSSSTLVVSPHPDDETLGCGCLIAELVRHGSEVHVAFVTDGGASHPGHPQWTPALLAERRRSEALVAAAKLGVPARNCHFIGAEDGKLAHLSAPERSHIERALRTILAATQPALLLMTYRSDGSSEHEACFEIARSCLRLSSPPRVLEYPIWSWWSPRLMLGFALSPGKLLRLRPSPKARRARDLALGSYVTQTEPLPPFREPVLPKSFVSFFLKSDHYFLEQPLPPSDNSRRDSDKVD